ncbi:hypothetical protein BJY04DRAFT_177008 [Aspergillus karnatakaensis]|uniref:uncharacterized protein n=1 Tax=Aspergillus karnatakaensis TaxID=1810916 RepID=UPI003CCDAD54
MLFVRLIRHQVHAISDTGMIFMASEDSLIGASQRHCRRCLTVTDRQQWSPSRNHLGDRGPWSKP